MPSYVVSIRPSIPSLDMDFDKWFSTPYDFQADSDREALEIAEDLQCRNTDAMCLELHALGFSEAAIAQAVYAAPYCGDHLYRITDYGLVKVAS